MLRIYKESFVMKKGVINSIRKYPPNRITKEAFTFQSPANDT
ncbi:hypothetical protein [Maribellus sp. CM-23]|nr:hypothetical protein [Maribellus sp. CM-23]